ncbi:NAD(P)/FAD-dependent oxidoreductase [Sediminivirga luteola]|uniref:Oxidoreductase n=1 Tax=Sediminivirga luteola TaxID=1774748 RepID=A0A8J2XJZ7_9MICO|nr:FAD-dependent oxidoreductase [Sediminivirga luteola]GGA09762.1 oxidoreductase [Sediminivirga luteola]
MTTFDIARREADWAAIGTALADAAPLPFWLDDPARPVPSRPLGGTVTADLAIVGGGYTGLWTAVQAKERRPDATVVLLEGGSLGWAASGRNGGFCEASLTHGASNGEAHLPGENARLIELGMENLDGIEATVKRYGMDCDFERTGNIHIATEEYQVAELAEGASPEHGVRFLDRESLRAIVDSPTYLAGLEDTRGTAMVHPAKLVWELARVARELGVEIYEGTVARRLERDGERVDVVTDAGRVRASRVALATNAFPSLLKRVSLHTVPVYDYALMTEPLSAEQLASIGWEGRQGLADGGNQFHYYRLTADNRILWGGYDAVYYYGRRISSRYDQRQETFERLAAHFFHTFPTLRGLRFTHRWGGAIDTCSRFFSFFETAYEGRVAHAAGFTGLGVGASRFAGAVMLDLLSGERTELTELELVRKKPIPFPPEPAAWLGVKLTTRALHRADRNEGRRGPLLKVLDSIGMGFDS